MWIVRELNERGNHAAAGGKWTVGNFQRLMTKKRYVTFDATDHPKDCPALRTTRAMELWSTTARSIERRGPPSSLPKSTP
jgi:hypothetical protein